MSRRSDRAKLRKTPRPPRPPPPPPLQPLSSEAAKAEFPSPSVRVSLAILRVFAEWLKHHLALSVWGIAATVVVVVFVLYRSQSACVRMPNTPLGPVDIGCGPSESPFKGSGHADGLHGDVYVDRGAGFSLRLPNGDQWSVVQPRENSDGTKRVVFPPGILGGLPVAMIVRDVSVVFVSKRRFSGGAPSAWVFRVPRR